MLRAERSTASLRRSATLGDLESSTVARRTLSNDELSYARTNKDEKIAVTPVTRTLSVFFRPFVARGTSPYPSPSPAVQSEPYESQGRVVSDAQ